MKQPLFVRPLTEEEEKIIAQGLRSTKAFTLKRSQIIRLSQQRKNPREISQAIGCASQTVRNVIHDFESRGIEVLQSRSRRPKTIQPIFNQVKQEQLRALLHNNPRNEGYNRSTWTLNLVTQACCSQGITQAQVSQETIRETLKRMGVSWKRAKNWITSPDEQYQRKKSQRKRLIELSQHYPEWVLGFLDEVWWSRLAQPSMHSWSQDRPLRLQQKKLEPEDNDTKALACYGLWCPSDQQMWLRFVEQRPVSDITCKFLEWVIQQLEQLGKKVLALIWDNASWHISQKVRNWIASHNAIAKKTGGIRLLVCRLPVKSPWLNSIEPKWIHGKRAIVEPERVLSASEIVERVCDYFDCEQLEFLTRPITQNVS